MTASTPGVNNYVHDPNVLPPGHAYAVIGYNTNTRTLRITNPWNDPTMKCGTTFDMKLDDFCKLFEDICIESRVGVND